MLEMNNKKKHNHSGTESPPSSKARILPTQCGGITGRHPAHCSSATSTPGPLSFLKFLGPPFHNFFIIHPRKKVLNQNDVEFHFSKGHALVLFCFFLIINKQCTVDRVRPPHTPQNSYISIYFGHKTLFSPNPMIIISGSFRNTSNYMK